MKIFLEVEDEVEIMPVPPTEDKAIVVTPSHIIKPERVTDIVKEMAAIDAIELSVRDAGAINGVSKSQAHLYSHGIGLSEEAKTRVLSKKYEIQDTAVTKLMQTLNLLDPTEMDNKEKISLVNSLSKVTSVGTIDEKSGVKVTLNLYTPNQKKEKDYEVIEA